MGLYKLLKLNLPYFWSKDWKIRALIISSIFFALLAIVCNLCIPIVLRSVLNFLNKANNPPEIMVIFIVASYGIIWIVAQVSLTLRSVFLFRPIHRVDRLMVLDFFKHILSLPLKYHLDRKTGSLLSTVQQARNGLKNIINAVLWQIIPLTLESIFAVIIISWMYGIIYAAIIFVTLILYFLTTFYTASKSTYYQNLSNETERETSSYLNDAIINYETIKYFDTDNMELAQCIDVLNKNENALTQTDNNMYMIGMLNMVIVGISIIIITCYAGV
jgi:ABC-type bacteriocin/lantibiotic exporter with double-glycine peptidase domain